MLLVVSGNLKVILKNLVTLEKSYFCFESGQYFDQSLFEYKKDGSGLRLDFLNRQLGPDFKDKKLVQI